MDDAVYIHIVPRMRHITPSYRIKKFGYEIYEVSFEYLIFDGIYCPMESFDNMQEAFEYIARNIVKELRTKRLFRILFHNEERFESLVMAFLQTRYDIQFRSLADDKQREHAQTSAYRPKENPPEKPAPPKYGSSVIKQGAEYVNASEVRSVCEMMASLDAKDAEINTLIENLISLGKDMGVESANVITQTRR